MSLREWQSALLTILPDPKQAAQILSHEKYQLTAAERDNLISLSQSAGLEVTCDVQLWWRRARLQIAIPFSMHLIERLDLQHLVALYQKRPCTTLFFLREAQSFLDYIQEHAQAPAILRDMVNFELALHMAKLRQSGDASTRRQITVLHLSHCPETCILALLQNDPLPEAIEDGVVIEISAEWPHLWQKISLEAPGGGQSRLEIAL
jgi:hypothetical protein